MRPPRTWLVLGDKTGDNGQVETVADGLGWPVERKSLHWIPPFATAKPKVRPSLHHLDRQRSDPLGPPWPDLILTIGRRPSMVALWIKEQSGGRTRIVLIGKPSGLAHRFDLVVASAEILLPPLANVMTITLPLMRPPAAAIATATATWAPRLAALPRPLIGILVGGPTMPFVFDQTVTDRLSTLARTVTERDGGTAYVVTSRRTPAATVARLRADLPPGARLFAWGDAAADNPYLALLGLADGFVVTGDSLSMITEVVRTGKAPAILDLPTSRLGQLDRRRRRLVRWWFDRWARGPFGSIAAARVGMALGTRDFEAFHRSLIAAGLAVPADTPLEPNRLPTAAAATGDASVDVVARIRAWWPEIDRRGQCPDHP